MRPNIWSYIQEKEKTAAPDLSSNETALSSGIILCRKILFRYKPVEKRRQQPAVYECGERKPDQDPDNANLEKQLC